MGDQFVYVSGRTRAAGEMNGKSSNLNNCLSQIYPPGIPIPPNELVCIFDADQVIGILQSPGTIFLIQSPTPCACLFFQILWHFLSAGPRPGFIEQIQEKPVAREAKCLSIYR